jgi:hypothetical protein
MKKFTKEKKLKPTVLKRYRELRVWKIDKHPYKIQIKSLKRDIIV